METISFTENLVHVEHPSSKVVQLTLDGSTPANFLDIDARLRTVRAIEAASRDSDVSSLILSGPDGASFCGGGDIRDVCRIRCEADIDAWLDSIITLFLALLNCPKPIVAAAQGEVKGQGLQLALLCDVRVAAYGARFGEPELTHGSGCAVGATILRHFASYGVATEMIYGCREIGAITAMQYNLINSAVRDQDLTSTALHWAQRLAGYSPQAFVHTKRIVARNMIEELKSCLPAARHMYRKLFVADLK
ncbi:enoyl-CoA hydratase/isomerase family protein [Caballeronia novacaledonica]|uniref:Enoyl-CoA hydratase/isomerase family protein n=1 Tax=Caballeronia novacaledonica TaxID=1544861 RepID=A0ACB5QLB3_9BURK|nr:enoyl-CoA hydratase/isomerase family protein [Caballeronia novacaledonica]GJH07180.1 enoyl-CoA hydratase/isomerase family protein [Caballeronia novacaledonica]GJH15687.1 enoyl-CoA hydratase/isomerase family protein [Caballeronia novacaledonica]